MKKNKYDIYEFKLITRPFTGQKAVAVYLKLSPSEEDPNPKYFLTFFTKNNIKDLLKEYEKM